jgi:hypothetical protein
MLMDDLPSRATVERCFLAQAIFYAAVSLCLWGLRRRSPPLTTLLLLVATPLAMALVLRAQLVTYFRQFDAIGQLRLPDYFYLSIMAARLFVALSFAAVMLRGVLGGQGRGALRPGGRREVATMVSLAVICSALLHGGMIFLQDIVAIKDEVENGLSRDKWKAQTEPQRFPMLGDTIKTVILGDPYRGYALDREGVVHEWTIDRVEEPPRRLHLPHPLRTLTRGAWGPVGLAGPRTLALWRFAETPREASPPLEIELGRDVEDLQAFHCSQETFLCLKQGPTVCCNDSRDFSDSSVQTMNQKSMFLTGERSCDHCFFSPDGAVQCSAQTFRPAGGVVTRVLGSATALSSNWGSACAIRGEGALFCWSLREKDPTFLSPQPVDLGEKVKEVSVGGAHACAVTESGRVFCWGYNRWGQLGDGSTVSWDRPVPVQHLTGVSSVVAWGGTSCAVREPGEVWCWGMQRRE